MKTVGDIRRAIDGLSDETPILQKAHYGEDTAGEEQADFKGFERDGSDIYALIEVQYIEPDEDPDFDEEEDGADG